MHFLRASASVIWSNLPTRRATIATSIRSLGSAVITTFLLLSDYWSFALLLLQTPIPELGAADAPEAGGLLPSVVLAEALLLATDLVAAAAELLGLALSGTWKSSCSLPLGKSLNCFGTE
jgi:hypothetical protein